MASLLHGLQETSDLTLEVAAESGNESRLIIQSTGSAEAREVRNLLALPADTDDFKITRLRKRQTDEISIIGRSLLDALQYLSHGVESPSKEQGRHDVLPAGLFRVRSQSGEPGKAFVKVRHLGTWFFIPQDDTQSKDMIGLLTQLFSLQAASGTGLSPLLSIPQ